MANPHPALGRVSACDISLMQSNVEWTIILIIDTSIVEGVL